MLCGQLMHCIRRKPLHGSPASPCRCAVGSPADERAQTRCQPVRTRHRAFAGEGNLTMTKTVTTDVGAEDLAEVALRAWLGTQGYSAADSESQVKELFDDGGFRSRFIYFMKFFNDAARRHLLVSGTAIGTE